MPNKVFGEKEKLIVCFTTFKNDPFPNMYLIVTERFREKFSPKHLICLTLW